MQGQVSMKTRLDTLARSRPAVSNGCVQCVPLTLLRPVFHSHFVVERSSITQGKGIIHAEMPVHAPGVPEPRGLQLWVDLPKQVRSCADGSVLSCKALTSSAQMLVVYSSRWW